MSASAPKNNAQNNFSSLKSKTPTEGSKSHKCSICQAVFLREDGLQIHLRSVHTGERPFKCFDCSKAFASKPCLNLHRRKMHSKDKPYPCAKCPKAYLTPSDLRDHFIRAHTTFRPFSCELCDKGFVLSKELHNHIRAVHTKELLHRCDLCRRSFSTNYMLMYHVTKFHSDAPTKSNVTHSTCIFCEQQVCKPYLSLHLRRHTGEAYYNCSICSKTFWDRNSRKCHERTHVSTSVKPVECEECGKTFDRAQHLRGHQKRMHPSGGRCSLFCIFCDAQFNWIETRNGHIRRHIGERVYFCKTCEMEFTNSGGKWCHEKVCSNSN